LAEISVDHYTEKRPGEQEMSPFGVSGGIIVNFLGILNPGKSLFDIESLGE
jgi:hypothetical protein